YSHWGTLVRTSRCKWGMDKHGDSELRTLWIWGAWRDDRTQQQFRSTRQLFLLSQPSTSSCVLPSLPVLLVGYHEVVVRFVFAACSLLSMAVMYALTRRLYGHTRAVWSAVFFTLTPMFAYFGRMPDHEAPAMLLLL